MSDGLNVGTVKGTVELEDRMSSAIDLLEHKIESLDQKFGGLGSHFAETAASFFTAEAALEAVKEAAHLAAETLREITIEGSHAADIENTFEHLTQSAGLLGDTLLSKTREGLRGTVTDMDIMTRVNNNLSVGLNLTADQMDTLSKGAFALAKSANIDVASAMDRLSDAMVTGRTRGIALLTGRIDLTTAEDNYAQKLGVSSDHLSEQGKQAAIQEAILTKVAEKTERLGEQHLRLADKIQQVKVEFVNFEEELGTAIATSPVIAAGFDGIRSAIGSAFGDNQAETIKKIAHVVDDVAISVLGFAEYVVDAVGVIGVEWNAAIVVFDSVKGGWDAIGYAGESALLAIMKGLNAISFGAFDEDVKLLEADVEGWYDAMAKNQQGIDEHKQAEDEWAVSTGKVKDVIEGVRQQMIEAKKTEGEFTEVIRDNKRAHEGAGDAAEKHGASEAKVGMTIAMSKEEVKKYNEAWLNLNSLGETWEDTLRTLSPQMQKTIQYYLDAGASVENLAAAFPALTKGQIESVKALEQSAKAEADAAESLSKLYSEFYNKKSQLYGTDTEKAIAAADKDYTIRAEELEKKGVKDVEYYNELWDLRNKDIRLADDQRLLDDDRSKASLDKKIGQAKDYFQFMMDHRDQYTQQDVEAQRGEVKRLQDTRAHWGEVSDSIVGAKGAVQLLDHAWVTDADIASDELNRTNLKVRMLSGEVISLKEALDRRSAGNSMTYDLSTQQGIQQFHSLNPAASSSYSDQQLMYAAQHGATLQSLIQSGIISLYGKGMPGFAEGGMGDFGAGTLAMLHGKEAIVPLDKSGGMGTTVLNFNVYGNTVQQVQQIKDHLMRELKTVRQFGAA